MIIIILRIEDVITDVIFMLFSIFITIESIRIHHLIPSAGISFNIMTIRTKVTTLRGVSNDDDGNNNNDNDDDDNDDNDDIDDDIDDKKDDDIDDIDDIDDNDDNNDDDDNNNDNDGTFFSII